MACKLGRHEGYGARQGVVLRRGHLLRQPEVGEKRLEVVRQQNVPRLDVTVHHALAVHELQAERRFLEDHEDDGGVDVHLLARAAPGSPNLEIAFAGVHQVCERARGRILHDHTEAKALPGDGRLVQTVDTCDKLKVHCRLHANLLHQALLVFGGQARPSQLLDRHGRLLVATTVDFPEAPLPNDELEGDRPVGQEEVSPDRLRGRLRSPVLGWGRRDVQLHDAANLLQFNRCRRVPFVDGRHHVGVILCFRDSERTVAGGVGLFGVRILLQEHPHRVSLPVAAGVHQRRPAIRIGSIHVGRLVLQEQLKGLDVATACDVHERGVPLLVSGALIGPPFQQDGDDLRVRGPRRQGGSHQP
mmetsp:Transcript_13608/g.50687  ORF Transcript_13608/g.50687 Transcript_13608/m.50687 type:complete len:359 (+) Transcript_13608:1881-2957(+)